MEKNVCENDSKREHIQQHDIYIYMYIYPHNINILYWVNYMNTPILILFVTFVSLFIFIIAHIILTFECIWKDIPCSRKNNENWQNYPRFQFYYNFYRESQNTRNRKKLEVKKSFKLPNFLFVWFLLSLWHNLCLANIRASSIKC